MHSVNNKLTSFPAKQYPPQTKSNRVRVSYNYFKPNYSTNHHSPATRTHHDSLFVTDSLIYSKPRKPHPLLTGLNLWSQLLVSTGLWNWSEFVLVHTHGEVIYSRLIWS